MAVSNTKHKGQPPYLTAYQRARLKAKRNKWPSAASTGLVPVSHLIKDTVKKLVDFRLPSGKNAKKPKKISACKNKSCTPIAQGYAFRQTSKRRPAGQTLPKPQKDSTIRPTYSFVYSFQFVATKARATYNVQAFYHETVDTFMLKFFNKSHKSLNKYAVRTGSGDFPAILHTNFGILMHLNKRFPKSSFGFIGERSFFKDKPTGQTLLEPLANNQRFRIYRLFLQQPARQRRLSKYFGCYYLHSISTVLLVNKKVIDSQAPYKAAIQILNYMAATYPTLNYSDL